MKGSSGVFGVLPGHVPTIAQLQPGTVTVEYDGDEGTKTEDFFVSASSRHLPTRRRRVRGGGMQVDHGAGAVSEPSRLTPR